MDGAGSPADLSARMRQIRQELERSDSDYDREKLQERLAKLSGGVAQIEVGAATETEMKEKKARVEDALHATRAAVEEGILPGGGTAFIRAEKAVQKLLDDGSLEGDAVLGAQVLLSALSVPLETIADNAGFEGDVIVRRIRKAAKNVGFDAAARRRGRHVRGRHRRPHEGHPLGAAERGERRVPAHVDRHARGQRARGRGRRRGMPGGMDEDF